MGSGSSALNYKPDEELPKKITAPAEVYFYGMGKPLDKDGKDKGLKEIWESWAFPKNGDSSVVIRPAVEGVHNDWSQRRFSMEYDKRLSAYGLDEAGFQEIIEKLNTLLRAFYPFQRDMKLAKKTKQSERGFNEDQKGIDSHTSTFYYAVEMRKILAKAGIQFPNTFWSLQIHKHMQGSDTSYFTEIVYHTVRIDLKEDMPKWWKPAELGYGSAWHVWDQQEGQLNHDLANKEAAAQQKEQQPPVASELLKGPATGLLADVTKTTADASSTSAAASAEAAAAKERQSKRKGSTSETLAGLKAFSADASAK